MKKYSILILVFAALLSMPAKAQKFKIFSTGFYNLENLFDTIHDEGKNDYEYLPDGTNNWGTLKYTNKLKNMAQVLSRLGTEMKGTNGKFVQVCKSPAILGVSEVENRRVLEDLLKEPVLRDKGWQILHIEAPTSVEWIVRSSMIPHSSTSPTVISQNTSTRTATPPVPPVDSSLPAEQSKARVSIS